MNVFGDAIGAGIVYHLSKKQLEQMDSENYETNEIPELQKIPENGTVMKEKGEINQAFSNEKL